MEEAQFTTSKIAETGSWLAPVVFSLQAIFYTYDGWHTAAYFSEEDRDPSKNLPKSMIGGVLVIIAIYLLCNLAILHVLPMDQLAQSKLAAADAITLIFGQGSGKIVTMFLMISILGIVNAQLLFNPRVLYSMSRDGLFLKSGVNVNQGGTPAVAMLISSGVAIGERSLPCASQFSSLRSVSAVGFQPGDSISRRLLAWRPAARASPERDMLPSSTMARMRSIRCVDMLRNYHIIM